MAITTYTRKLAEADEDTRQHLLRLLAKERKARRISQTQVGRVLGIGQPAVSDIERGVDVRFSTLQKYAAAIGVTLEISIVSADEED